MWSSTPEAPFSFEGTYFHVKDAYLSLKPTTQPHPPIYLAGPGPKMTRLTGEVADGWTPIGYTPETYASAWQDVETAAGSVGRDPGAIDRALTRYTVVLADAERAKEAASTFGRLLLTARPRLLRELGYAELAADRLDVVQTSGVSAGAELVDRIPAALGERVTICGNPDEAIGRIEAFIEAGVRLFVL